MTFQGLISHQQLHYFDGEITTALLVCQVHMFSVVTRSYKRNSEQEQKQNKNRGSLLCT